MEVEKLTDYYLDNDYAKFGALVAYIYNTFKPLNKDFPNYNSWFFNKQIAELSTGNREVLFIRNEINKNDIIAIACLKKTPEEQKICGIYVKENHRNLGYGTKLFEKSFEWLKNDKPSISIFEEQADLFRPFIDRYNWNLTYMKENSFINKKEYCYNKTKEKSIIKQKESH